MDTSPIHIDLNELALRGGERYERIYPLEMAPIVLGGQNYQVLVPDGITVVVDRVAGGFLVKVSLVAMLYGSCERCLQETKVAVGAEQQEFVPTAKDGWDESDLSPFIQDMIADISGLAREATVLSVPSQMVCSPGCLGLCQICGQDLNTGPCGCPAEAVDERWSALRDITLDE
jgi:uncharacterized protein